MLSVTQRISSWCKNQSPWQQRGFVFMLGALSVLALSPFYIVHILFVTVPLFLLAHDNTPTMRGGFWLGWWFGFGYFTFGLYWIAHALFVDIASFWWILPFAVMGLPFALSFFWAVASVLLVKLKPAPIAKWLLFAVLFSVFEWLRGHLFTGFPWNLIGYTWVDTPAILQGASLVGVYGLTLYTFLLTGSFYLLMQENKRKAPVMVILILTVSLYTWGAMRANDINNYPPTETNIRLVQPNIAQKDKWVDEKIPQHFDKLVALSSQPSSKSIDAILWPESAVAFFDTLTMRRFEKALPNFVPEGAHLITGILDYDRNAVGETTAYNRLGVFDHKAEPVAHYDKHHLVPFGEYLPFEHLWPINPIASNGLMFTAGRGIQTLWVDGLPQFSPLICYEAIFPGEVAQTMIDAPSWILNLTNDAWYGKTTGPYQHLAITQTRAVEEGLPMVRVANTGISAVVDASGQIVQSLPLETSGVMDVALPDKTKTFYAVFGDAGFFVFLVLLTGLGMYFRKHD